MVAVSLFFSLQLATLHDAVREGNVARVEALLDGGTPVDIEAGNGMTALHVAAVLGRCDVAELLITRGADVNDRAANGTTPLIRAAVNGHEETVRLLLAAGADADLQSNLGETALSVARKGRHQGVAALLEGRSEAAAVDLSVHKARILYRTGVALADRGQTEQAIESFRRALEVRPEYVEAQYRLARVLEQEAAPTESVLYYRKSVESYDRLLASGQTFDIQFARMALEDICDALARSGYADDASKCGAVFERLP